MGRGAGERAFERSGSEGVRKGGTGQREKRKLKNRILLTAAWYNRRDNQNEKTHETIKMERRVGRGHG